MSDIYVDDLPVDSTPTADARALVVNNAGAELVQGPTEAERLATTDAAYATAAQGVLADAALQPADIGATVQAYPVPVADITATGTPTSSTFLRGDGIWTATSGSGGGDLLAANDLSDVASVGTARTNLGLAVGSNVQAWAAILDATTASFLTADETKLDAIEALADVTDAANVATAGAIMETLVDVKGDILAATADDTVARLVAGANGEVLSANSAEATGLEWVALGAGDLVSTNNLSDVDNAGTSRTNLGLAIGTDVQAWDAVLDATTASFLTADETKLDGIEALADVTDTANVTSAGALMDSEVDADLKTFVVPASTTISAFGATLVDDAAASNARTTLGLGDMAEETAADYALRADTWTLVNHGSTASTARPTGWAGIIWYGSVQPTNIDDEDIVIRTDEAV